MATAESGKRSAGAAPGAPPYDTRRWMARLQLSLGLSLAGVAGMWVGRAWSEGTILSWVTGLLSLTCGIAVSIMGMRRSALPREPRQYRPPEQGPTRRHRKERALPFLGELLVNKYQVITERQLHDALAEQQSRGGRLGQMLVALGFVEYSQIADALEDQLSYGDPWRGLAGRLRTDALASSVPTDSK